MERNLIDGGQETIGALLTLGYRRAPLSLKSQQ